MKPNEKVGNIVLLVIYTNSDKDSNPNKNNSHRMWASLLISENYDAIYGGPPTMAPVQSKRKE